MPNRQHSITSRTSLKTSTDKALTAEIPALAVIESNQRWWALQIEAMEAALAENTEQSRAMLENVSTTAETLSQWPNLYQINVQRYTDLTRIGLELTAQTIVQLNDLMREFLSSSLAGTPVQKNDQRRDAATPEDFGERRVSARVIFFPDRRKSAESSGETLASEAETILAQSGRKRKQA